MNPLTQQELARLDELETLTSLTEAEEWELQRLLDRHYGYEEEQHFKNGKEIK